MTKLELKKKLIEISVRTDLYSLDGGFPNEAYCLNKNENVWEVYYSERGSKSNLRKFYSENEACDYLYNLIVDSVTST